MGKQYTYFRKSDGKPDKGRGSKYAPEHILSEIGKTVSVNSSGELSYSGFRIEKLLLALQSSLIVLDPDNIELNEIDTWNIVYRALNSLLSDSPGNSVKPLKLLDKADKEAADFFRKSAVQYVLISSLSIKDLPTRKIRVRDCTITPLADRGSKFTPPQNLFQQSQGDRFSRHIHSSNYRQVEISTEGRSIHEATERALNSLNLLRGFWSLYITDAWVISFSNNERKPLGVIHTGPIHTLHFLDGKPVDDNHYWYHPDFTEDQPIYQDLERLKRVERQRKSVIKRLESQYKKELEALLIRYINALDQPNTDIAFLQMWSILEKITDTIGKNYEETIKRAIWPFPIQEKHVADDMLQSIRLCRNQYVHSCRVPLESDQVAYMIKSFVDPHLRILIDNQFRVKSLKEYGEVLSLPTDIPTLKNRQRLLKQALTVLQH